MRALLVPVKSFDSAKARLAPALGANERSALARELASQVLAARASVPAFVVCDDGDVARWAEHAGATVLWTPGLGLSGAVAEGVARLGARGFDLVVVAHADLPLASDLSGFGTPGIVTLAPDRRLDGTNVAAVPTSSGFRFAYGPGSFSRHRAEAARIGLACRLVYDSSLAVDIDLPEDLAILEALRGRGAHGASPGRLQRAP